MNFLNRLKFYLIGVGLGILMVLAIFKDRKLTSWTPKNQVLKEISEKEKVINDNVLCCLNHFGIQDKNEIDSLLSLAEIDFKKSDVQDHDNRKYLLNIEEFHGAVIQITLSEDSVFINEVSIKQDCPCD